MPEDALQLVYHSVIVGRLLYASCAWNGVVSAVDRKRVDAFLRRSKRCGFCPTDRFAVVRRPAETLNRSAK